MRIDDAITVAVIFGGKEKIRPVWFIWNGREYRIKRITYVWKRREGRSLLYYFSLTDTAENFYEICYRTDTVTWYLLNVETAD